MQPHVVIFLDLFALVLTLVSYAILAESYMIPSLSNISFSYGLSQQSTGFILAVGASIPEFTTNLISSLQGKSENAALGVGAITGSGSFDFTLCFSIASLFTVGNGLQFTKYLYYRDSLVYILTAFCLMMFLWDNKIYLYEAIILVCLWPLYLVINWLFFSNLDHETGNNQDEKLNKNTDIENPNQKENIIIPGSQNDIDNNTNKINHDYLIENEIGEDAKLLLKENQDTNNVAENNKEQEQPTQNIFLKTVEIIANFLRTIYYYILPSIDKYPFIALIIILLIAYYHSKFVVSLVEDVSDKTNIAASFFGITLISWAGNVGDSINASVAAKAKKVDILTTSILASQIMNLQICLGVPWIISMFNNHSLNKGYFVDFGKENVLKLFLPLLIVVGSCVLVIFLFSRRLNRYSGFCLVIIYMGYFIFESLNSKKQE